MSTATLGDLRQRQNAAEAVPHDSKKGPPLEHPGPLEAHLEEIERFLQRLEGAGPAAAATVRELRQRLAAGCLHLAVLGQFKRGKSTLLNALLGREILPTAVVPLTAVPTFLRSGQALGLRASYADGREAESQQAASVEELRGRLTGLVTETGNPENRLGISRVDVFLPSPLLARGVVLIDTPGIGSTLRHNTEATLNFLPQCDAALFVLSADPPITEAEAQFLKTVRAKVRRLFFLINKVDYLSPAELEQTAQFVRAVLVDKAGVHPDADLFYTSARRGLEARRTGDSRLWEASGLKAVEEHLVGFLAEEKHRALAEAVCVRVAAVLEEAALGLELARRAWQLPLEDLERKAAAFSAKAEELRREADRSEDLLSGDQQRLRQRLEDYAEQLRGRARAHLAGQAARQTAGGQELSEQRLQAALAAVIPGFFEGEMTAALERFKQELEGVLEPHRGRAAQLVAALQATAEELFEVPVGAVGGAETLQVFQEPYWVTYTWDTALHSIPPGLIDRLLPRSRRRARLLRRLSGQLEELVIRNVENLRWSILQSLDRAFLVTKPLVRQRLNKILNATQEAVARTLAQRRAAQEASTRELPRLQAALRELRRLQSLVAAAAEAWL